MSFLAPTLGLIAAAITLPILVGYYLLKLRRRPVRISSTMLWEQAVRDLQANIPFRWLKPSWMLLVHLLLVACILLAIARPALDASDGIAGRVLIVIDRSASMAALDASIDGEPASRLDAARQKAIEYLTDLERSGFDGEVSIIAMAGSATQVGQMTGDLGLAIAALEAIEQSDQPADIEAALELAEALSLGGARASEAETPEPALVMLFTDGWLPSERALTLAGATVRLQQVGPPPPAAASGENETAGIDNIGITSIAARRDYDDPTLVRVFVRLLNASTREHTVGLALSIAGEPIERRAVAIAPTTFDEAGRPEVGQSAATFAVERREGGIAVVEIDRRDVLMTDNRAATVLAEAGRPVIWHVRPTGAAPPTDRAGVFMQGALDALDVERVVRMSGLEFDDLTAGGVEPDADLVVFEDVTPARAPRVATLSIGSPLPVAGLGFAGSDDPPLTRRFLTWERSHPVLRHAALDQVVVSVADGYEPGATALARTAAGAMIASSEAQGVRRLGVRFPLAQSNWPLVPVSFPLFIASAVDWLTLRGEASGGQSFTTIEPVLATPLPGAERIRAIGPDERLLASTRVEPQDRAAVSLGLFERAGIVALEGATAPAAAINLASVQESACWTADRLEVSGQAIRAGADGVSGPREIWHWFVLAAVVLMLVEWVLYGLSMRIR